MSTGSVAVDGVSPDLVELRARAERHRSSHFVHVDPEAVLWCLDRIKEARDLIRCGEFYGAEDLARDWFASVEETP